MKVLVTGGGGYIGYDLVNFLNARQDIDKIYIYDNFGSSETGFLIGEKKLLKVVVIHGDILDRDKLDSIMGKVDVVYHLAAHVHFPLNHIQSFQFEQVNRWGTLSIVRSIQNHANIKIAIYTSSSVVQGFMNNLKLTAPAGPQSPYALSKFQGEQYFDLLAEHCSTHIVRLGNVFGFNPLFRIDSVINKFIVDSIVKNKVLIYGNGKQKRAFLSIRAAAMQLVNLLDEEPEKRTRTLVEFNASLNELYELLKEKVTTLESNHINVHQEFETQSFEALDISETSKSIFNDEYERFRDNLRIYFQG
jgi:UDP-glucose 4-epimerase